MTSLSPFCGFEVFTTPTPHAFWSTRTQKLRPGSRKVGTVKPGWSQHVVVLQPEFGSVQPGMPAHAASGFPQEMQAVCSQRGGLSACAIVNVVLIPRGNGSVMRSSAVTQGVCAHPPVVPPQSASVVQLWNRFAEARAVQSFGPEMLSKL